jgi:anti-sigma B factor antagonist
MLPFVPDFRVEVVAGKRETLVKVSGELDIATAGKLGRALEELGADGRRIVVSLAEVWFIDAIAARRLLRARSVVEAAGGTLTLTDALPQAERLFELGGLRHLFEFVPPLGGAAADPAT